MIIIALALIDIHTLFVLLLADTLPFIWVLSGSTMAILKGLFFYIPTRDFFSLLDIIVGLTMLFLLITTLHVVIFWMIFIYLIYKIIMSFIFL